MKRLLAAISVSFALLLPAVPAHADVDDFSFASFDATYELSRDADGHAVLRTTETLVAQFPDSDQNHGIRRQLVDRYDGHPTGIEIESVTDEAGNARDYETDTDDGFLDVTIADDDYVHGQQTYVITYTARDVVLFTNDVEDFYWDTNGTGWEQPFGSVTARVVIDPSLRDALTGAVDSSYGAEGEDLGEALTRQTETGYEFAVTDLRAEQNLTFAIGFEPGTFTPRPSGFFDSPLPTLALLFLFLTFAGFVSAIVVRSTVLRNAPGHGIIAAEYVPPKGVPLPISAVVGNRRAKAVPAQLIQLAVSGNLRVRESTTGRKPSYEIEFVTYEGTDDYGKDFLKAFFGAKATPGKTRSLKKQNSEVADAVSVILKRATKDATTLGFRRKRPAGALFGISALTTAGTIGTFILSMFSLDQSYGGAIPILFLVLAIALGIAVIAIVAKVPLDAAGVALRDHLSGLKVYIDLAEEARLRYLQSPEGAERLPVDATDRGAVVKLNEKLLPYAVLFGNEKRWAREIGEYYEQTGTKPDWYFGSTAFNVAYFSSAIGSVSSSASSSFSSSSSGSGGGSSSGGGGGGGGGGGV